MERKVAALSTCRQRSIEYRSSVLPGHTNMTDVKRRKVSDQEGETGVLSFGGGKGGAGVWWCVFGAACLLTLGTRLYKVN